MTTADFRAVDVKDNPSVLRCRQFLELGIVTFDCNSVKTLQSVVFLTKEKILFDNKYCFDKIEKIPGGKYCIKLIDDAKPVVHKPQTVPVHVMPLYKAELDKMLAEDIISSISEPGSTPSCATFETW